MDTSLRSPSGSRPGRRAFWLLVVLGVGGGAVTLIALTQSWRASSQPRSASTAPAVANATAFENDPHQEDADAWQSLLAGPDLAGWDVHLNPVPGQLPAPETVFVAGEEGGQPTLRITGTATGALTTRQEYENFHLRGEFRWNKATTSGAEPVSGLLYHCVGQLGAEGHGGLSGLEFRVAPGQSGSLALARTGGVSVETEGQLSNLRRSDDPVPLVQYHKAGRRFTVPLLVPPFVLRQSDQEKPIGQWNTFEVLTVGDVSEHRVNGRVVLVVTEARRWVGLQAEPVRKGKIQVRAAGAEVSYRNLAIRPLQSLPVD